MGARSRSLFISNRGGDVVSTVGKATRLSSEGRSIRPTSTKQHTYDVVDDVLEQYNRLCRDLGSPAYNISLWPSVLTSEMMALREAVKRKTDKALYHHAIVLSALAMKFAEELM